jgi:hypothetical protein
MIFKTYQEFEFGSLPLHDWQDNYVEEKKELSIKFEMQTINDILVAENSGLILTSTSPQSGWKPL